MMRSEDVQAALSLAFFVTVIKHTFLVSYGVIQS